MKINKVKPISYNYLQSWYQDSMDTSKEPIWTDEHLEELYKDFDLYPKSNTKENLFLFENSKGKLELYDGFSLVYRLADEGIISLDHTDYEEKGIKVIL